MMLNFWIGVAVGGFGGFCVALMLIGPARRRGGYQPNSDAGIDKSKPPTGGSGVTKNVRTPHIHIHMLSGVPTEIKS